MTDIKTTIMKTHTGLNMTLSKEQRTQILMHPMFSGFSTEIQDELLSEAQYREHHPQHLILRQGDTAERFFLVLEGKVKLFRISADGKEKVVEIIQPGHTFAEAVMFMNKPLYPVCAESLDAVKLISFSNRMMLDYLERYPKICLHLLGHLSIRLHQRLDELENLTLQNATQRFALYLVSQIKDRTEDCVEMDLMLPKGLIAARLSIKPETLSRVMATLRGDGLIESRGRHITIPSVSRLLSEFSAEV